MNKTQITLLVTVIILVALFFIFDLGRYFNLEYLKEQQAAMDAFYDREPLTTTVSYFLLYVIITGLSLPGAAILTLAAGAIFGLLWGTIVVSFASTIGATLAFLVSRYLFREAIQGRFADKLTAINRGMDEERRILPVHPAPGALIPVFYHQPRHGTDHYQGIDLLSRQPGRDAGRDHRICECRYADRKNRADQGYRITGVDPVIRAAGHLPVAGEKNGRLPEKTQNPQMTRPAVIPAHPPSSFPRRRESSRQTVALQATLYNQALLT